MVFVSQPIEPRFWTKVDKTGGKMACWPWLAYKGLSGYGIFTINGKNVRAHRVAYELLVAPISKGLTIDHLCRNRGCVNPEHLEPVPGGVNTLRSPTAASAVNARKTHCNSGHPLSGANLAIIRASGWRVCKICRKMRLHEYRQRLKEREEFYGRSRPNSSGSKAAEVDT